MKPGPLLASVAVDILSGGPGSLPPTRKFVAQTLRVTREVTRGAIAAMQFEPDESFGLHWDRQGQRTLGARAGLPRRCDLVA